MYMFDISLSTKSVDILDITRDVKWADLNQNQTIQTRNQHGLLLIQHVTVLSGL